METRSRCAGLPVAAQPAGVHGDLVGQHEVAQHADAEAAVGEQLHRRVEPGPLGLLLEELGQVAEAHAGLGEDLAELAYAHADAVVDAVQVRPAVVVDALARTGSGRPTSRPCSRVRRRYSVRASR